MSFKTTNSNDNILLVGVGVILTDFESWVHTVEDGYSTTAPAEAGFFAMIDDDGKLAKYDGSKPVIGMAVHESTNQGVGLKCDDNPIQSYMSLGCSYLPIKAGLAPKRGDYLKADNSGVADIGTATDKIGRFLGIYGQPTTDATPLKTMLVQLGGV